MQEFLSRWLQNKTERAETWLTAHAVTHETRTIQRSDSSVSIAMPSLSSVGVFDITVEPYTVATLFFNVLQPTLYSLKIGEGAGVHIIVNKIAECNHFSVNVGRRAQCTFTGLLATDAPSFFSSNIELTGEGANVHQQLAVLGAAAEQVYAELTFDHVVPNTTGRVVVRRAQWGESLSAVYGLLKITAAAHRTDTYLSDKALLLGAKSRATSVPSLEILADDVRASHGVSTGKLSPDELFYLRSRGLSEITAETLLVNAFFEEVLVGVPPEYRDSLLTRIAEYAEEHS